MSIALIALGSNLEPRLHFMQQAVLHIHQVGRVLRVAPLYESIPYGITDQPLFLNSALSLETSLEPHRLLAELKSIERRVGRIPRQRWGPREIDLDIIFYDLTVLKSQTLTIPHPDYRNRCFVLIPLADIDPDFVPPGDTHSLSDLAKQCTGSKDITYIQRNWVSV